VLPQLQAHVVARAEDSLYWGPVTNLPTSFDVADRERLTVEYRAAIETKIVPSYRRLHDFMRDEYLPRCRTSVGLDALPDGKAWYEYNVRSITTTDFIRTDPRDRPARGQAHQGEMRGVITSGVRGPRRVLPVSQQ
jgi:uncharacterized protein (DUF885 family)